MRNLVRAILAAALAVALSFPASRAGYLDVSTKWSAPSTAPMSKRAALSVVSERKAV